MVEGVTIPSRTERKGGAGRSVSAAATFDGATFEAKVHEVKIMPSGEVRLVILVPESDKAEGVKMGDAYAFALRVTVDKMDFG